MKQVILVAILCTLITLTPAVPIEQTGITYPLPWQTILMKATEYMNLYDRTFSTMRNVVEEENTAIGFIISEQVILAHRKALGIAIQVIKKIYDQNLTCKDIRFFTGEAIDIFVDITNFLIKTPEISSEGKGRLRAIYVETVLSSSTIVNQVAALVGCPPA